MTCAKRVPRQPHLRDERAARPASSTTARSPSRRPRTVARTFEPDFVALNQKLRAFITDRELLQNREWPDHARSRLSPKRPFSAGTNRAVFVGWELFCVVTHMSDLVLPRPSQVFVTLYLKFPILWPHILQTLATTMIGFVLGVGLGCRARRGNRPFPKRLTIPAIRCWSASHRSRRSPWCRSSCCGSAPVRCRRY